MDETNLGEKAKQMLMDFVPMMDEKLKKYWEEEINNNFGFNETQKELVKKMLLHASEHNLRVAKRLRGAFVCQAYMLDKNSKNQELKKSKQYEEVWKVAEGVELVHTALLMHDDMTDMDKVRRGGPTTQEFFANGDIHYGESMAVYVGDTVLCLGFERVLASNFESEKIKRVSKQLLRGVTNTALGQSYDVSLPKLGEITEEKVMSLHRAKTAIYTYENPLLIGGLLGGVSDEVLGILKDYAVDGGIAFQLQDDVLGVFGDEDKTGKSANSDLLQGKVTLLIVKTLELGTEEQKKDLLKVWGKLKAKNEEIERAKIAIKESGAYGYSVRVAREYAERAANTAAKLRMMDVNLESVDFIEGIARYMVERDV